MRSITEGNTLLGRLFNMPVSAAPLPPVATMTVSKDGGGPSIPFTELPAGTYQTGPAVRELRQTNFLAQADAASKMSIPLPPGAVSMGDGAMRDSYIINVPASIHVEPLSEASLPDWDEAIKVLDRGDLDEIVTLVQSVSPAMAALLMGHIKPAAAYYAGLVRRLIIAASNDILATPPDDEPGGDDAEE
jgi:hypothetical protein